MIGGWKRREGGRRLRQEGEGIQDVRKGLVRHNRIDFFETILHN